MGVYSLYLEYEKLSQERNSGCKHRRKPEAGGGGAGRGRGGQEKPVILPEGRHKCLTHTRDAAPAALGAVRETQSKVSERQQL